MGQREIWNDLVGDAWVRHADVIDAHSAPFGEAAMDLLGSLDGSAVLDVGCGTGTTTLELVRRGAASVLGVDLSERMIGHARTRSEGDAGRRARFEAADIMTMAPIEPFDAVYSRFGVMFFDDAVIGFTRLRELARPGARLGFCSWRDAFANPWMSLAVMASAGVIGFPQLPGAGEPGPFSMAEPEHVHEVLTHAGWRDVVIEELVVEQPHPAGDADAVAAVLVENVPSLAEGLARHPDKGDELRAAVADALRPHEREAEVHLAAAALVVGADA